MHWDKPTYSLDYKVRDVHMGYPLRYNIYIYLYFVSIQQQRYKTRLTIDRVYFERSSRILGEGQTEISMHTYHNTNLLRLPWCFKAELVHDLCECVCVCVENERRPNSFWPG